MDDAVFNEIQKELLSASSHSKIVEDMNDNQQPKVHNSKRKAKKGKIK